jgi:hypothetical protein
LVCDGEADALPDTEGDIEDDPGGGRLADRLFEIEGESAKEPLTRSV